MAGNQPGRRPDARCQRLPCHHLVAVAKESPHITPDLPSTAYCLLRLPYFTRKVRTRTRSLGASPQETSTLTSYTFALSVEYGVSSTRVVQW